MGYIWDRIEKRRMPIDQVAKRVTQRASPDDLPSECFISKETDAYLIGFNAAKTFIETDKDPECPFKSGQLYREWNNGFEEGLYQDAMYRYHQSRLKR